MGLQQSTTADYQQKLSRFLADVERVSKLEPREEFLYPILDTPVFADLQTALMMAKLNYRACEKAK